MMTALALMPRRVSLKTMLEASMLKAMLLNPEVSDKQECLTSSLRLLAADESQGGRH
jgi:hypothetical protein